MRAESGLKMAGDMTMVARFRASNKSVVSSEAVL